ncbi:MAG: methionyl-tRNA formyltransferase [Pseudomonadota bacterium]|nr:methionyl-tRNA formyltransferase [Pseudomonadota bacterium]
MKIVFAGTPEFAASSLHMLLNAQAQHGFEVIAVYSQPDRPAGRGQKLTASPVKQLALTYGLPIYQPLNFKASTTEGLAAQAELAALQPDLMIVAAYGLILPQAVLDIPRLGCLNIHASILPRWRGAAPIHRALLAGDPETGITIMQMNAGLDTGDILRIVRTPILPTDTSGSLHDRLAVLGGDAMLATLANLATDQAAAIPQDESQVTYAHKLAKAEGQIDWSQSAAAIDRQIRGLQPWPVAFCQHNGQTLRVWSAELPEGTSDQTAGTVTAIGKYGVNVVCGDGQLLRLTALQWAGGKPLNAVQMFQANKIQLGDILA